MASNQELEKRVESLKRFLGEALGHFQASGDRETLDRHMKAVRKSAQRILDEIWERTNV